MAFYLGGVASFREKLHQNDVGVQAINFSWVAEIKQFACRLIYKMYKSVGCVKGRPSFRLVRALLCTKRYKNHKWR